MRENKLTHTGRHACGHRIDSSVIEGRFIIHSVGKRTLGTEFALDPSSMRDGRVGRYKVIISQDRVLQNLPDVMGTTEGQGLLDLRPSREETRDQ